MVESVARAAAGVAGGEGVAPLVLAPALAYGRSDHHFGLPGTLSLRSETLAAVLRDLVRSLPESGLERLFVLGHGGNDATLRTALADAADAYPVIVGGASYWTIAWDALRDAGADDLVRYRATRAGSRPRWCWRSSRSSCSSTGVPGPSRAP